jgi:hypothetical protein
VAALQPSFFMEEIMFEIACATMMVSLWAIAGLGMLHEVFRD